MRTALTTIVLSALMSACSGARPEQPAPTPSPTPTPSASTAEKTTMPNPPTKPATQPANSATTEVATFANGCFWCTEAVLEQLDGVIDATSGYIGGDLDNPTYQQVCSGTTGHAEAVQVTFDPKKISYESLLDWFFRSHDPTTKDRQGADVGTQYRSGIFFHSPEQERKAHAAIAKYQQLLEDPIVTEVTAATTFFPAEQYHQDFYRLNPQQGYCRAAIAPKLKKLGLDPHPAADGTTKKK